MTATDRARNHATDTCHWCHRIWFLAVDLADGRSKEERDG